MKKTSIITVCLLFGVQLLSGCYGPREMIKKSRFQEWPNTITGIYRVPEGHAVFYEANQLDLKTLQTQMVDRCALIRSDKSIQFRHPISEPNSTNMAQSLDVRLFSDIQPALKNYQGDRSTVVFYRDAIGPRKGYDLYIWSKDKEDWNHIDLDSEFYLPAKRIPYVIVMYPVEALLDVVRVPLTNIFLLFVPSWQ